MNVYTCKDHDGVWPVGACSVVVTLDGNQMKHPKESTRRWWMDREGNVWLNVAALRRKPLTDEEAKQMQQLAKEKAARGADELH